MSMKLSRLRFLRVAAKTFCLAHNGIHKDRTNLSLRSLITTTKLRVANPKNWKQIADFMIQ